MKQTIIYLMIATLLMSFVSAQVFIDEDFSGIASGSSIPQGTFTYDAGCIGSGTGEVACLDNNNFYPTTYRFEPDSDYRIETDIKITLDGSEGGVMGFGNKTGNTSSHISFSLFARPVGESNLRFLNRDTFQNVPYTTDTWVNLTIDISNYNGTFQYYIDGVQKGSKFYDKDTEQSNIPYFMRIGDRYQTGEGNSVNVSRIKIYNITSTTSTTSTTTTTLPVSEIDLNLYLNDTLDNIVALEYETFSAYYLTNYTAGSYIIERNGTPISNNSVQNLTEGYYNFTVYIEENASVLFASDSSFASIGTTTTSTTTTSTTTTSTTTTTLTQLENDQAEGNTFLGIVIGSVSAVIIIAVFIFIIFQGFNIVKSKRGKKK